MCVHPRRGRPSPIRLPWVNVLGPIGKIPGRHANSPRPPGDFPCPWVFAHLPSALAPSDLCRPRRLCTGRWSRGHVRCETQAHSGGAAAVHRQTLPCLWWVAAHQKLARNGHPIELDRHRLNAFYRRGWLLYGWWLHFLNMCIPSNT